MEKIIYTLLFVIFFCFEKAQTNTYYYLQILGIAQDAGYPQTGCKENCCESAWKKDSLKKYVVSLALIDSVHKKWWLFEATPDIKFQLQYFQDLTKKQYSFLPDGIFLTHAHIGHYAGLMQLGREVMNTKEVPVYVLPKMKSFIENNGPWSQLISQKNIVLKKLSSDSIVQIAAGFKLEPFLVPHRDEFSETAGFKIITSGKKYLFIPDIDKWEKWNKNIVKEVESVDYALLDGTFCEMNELKNRNISEIPHPLVTETMQLFLRSNNTTRAKVIFIHFNHTNKILWDQQTQTRVKAPGFKIAVQGETL